VPVKRKTIAIEQIEVDITWKRIKHCYIRLQPPDGRVLLNVPLRMSMKSIHTVLQPRIEWIRARQSLIRNRPVQPTLQYRNGELHPYLGKYYPLQLDHNSGRDEVCLQGCQLTMKLARHTDTERCRQLLEHWYRQQLESLLPPLLQKWEPLIGVQVKEWRIKRMKTRWGSCNTVAKRVWMNLELIKKPVECIEYVLVHELVHLLEPSHNKRFYTLLEQFLPDWKARRDMLRR